MTHLINEIKRLQQLAGLINESQLEEVDDSILGGIAKNLYLYINKMKPNNPLDINGSPLKNIKGDPIVYNKKVKMTYQNPELGKQGKAKELGRIVQGNVITSSPEVSISYYASIIFVGGFVKKEEAEEALKYILNKYPNQLKGLHGEPKVVANKTEYEWAKNHAPTYSFDLKVKDDKELAKTKSTKPSAEPQQESFDIESIVNEALAKLKQEAAAPTNKSADVQSFDKQQKSSAIASRAKAINDLTEFPGAFESWITSLGPNLQAGKISRSQIISKMNEVLTKLGYK